VEGPGKSIKQDNSATVDGGQGKITATTWTGRTDTNKRVVIPLAHDPLQPCPVLVGLSRAEALQFAGLHLQGTNERDVEEKTSEIDDESEDILVVGTSLSSSAAALTSGLDAVAALVRDVAGSRSPQQQPVLGEIEKGERICGFNILFSRPQ
jgi:hypothetical protein